MKAIPASSLWHALTTTIFVFKAVFDATNNDFKVTTSIEYISAYFVSNDIAFLSP